MKLRVTYKRPQDFVADYDGQFSRGGLLIRVLGLDLSPQTTLELELVTSFGSVTVPATVFQVLANVGIAVGFDAKVPFLESMIRSARAAGAIDGGSEPIHEMVGAGALAQTGGEPAKVRRPRAEAGAKSLDIRSRLRDASMPEKVQIALHGTKDERNIIIRGPDRRLHQYVIRNPQIQLDEIAAIARMTTVAVDILKFIAGRREWAQRPEVAIALVRNAKTPVPLAVKMVEHCSPSDLRQLAKASSLRPPIQRAVRKKVVG